MAAFNGFRSWNAWNVSLWINNDEGLYNMARDYYQDKVDRIGNNDRARRWAARRFVNDMGTGARTPDGAKYNVTCVYEAMEGMLD